MRRLVSTLPLLALAGCIDWEHADLGFCNTARLERRFEVCDPDRTFSGPLGEVVRLETIASTPPPLKLVATPLGAWQVSLGAVSYELQRLDAQGSSEGEPRRIGTSANWMIPLLAADGATLVTAATFTGVAQLPSGGTVQRDTGSVVMARLGADGAVLAERVLEHDGTYWGWLGALAARAGEVALTLHFQGDLEIDGVVITSNFEPVLLVLDEQLRYRWHMVSSGCAPLGVTPGSVALDGAGTAYFALSLSSSGTCQLDGRPLTFVDDRPPPEPWMPALPPLYGHFVAKVTSGSSEASVQWIDAWSDTGWPQLAMLNADRLLQLRRAADSRLRELSPEGALLHEITFGFRDSALSVGPEGEVLFFGDFRSGHLTAGPLQLGPFDDAPNGIVYQPTPNGGAVWAQAVVADETIRTAQWANYPPSHSVHLVSASFGGGRAWLMGTHWGNLWLRFTHQLPSSPGTNYETPEPWFAVLQFGQ